MKLIKIYQLGIYTLVYFTLWGTHNKVIFLFDSIHIVQILPKKGDIEEKSGKNIDIFKHRKKDLSQMCIFTACFCVNNLSNKYLDLLRMKKIIQQSIQFVIALLLLLLLCCCCGWNYLSFNYVTTLFIMCTSYKYLILTME